jgi:hypothetical protein
MKDALVGINGKLLRAVAGRGAGVQDLADPVLRQRKPGSLGQAWHALATPTGEVRNQDLRSQV